jgi:hypothetical protein
MKSWTEPTTELVNRAITSTLDSTQRQYFFNKLENPMWVKPLWENGFFRKPPEPRPTGDRGFQIPFWEESRYLARVAKDAPMEVAEIASNIRTENIHILEDIVDIAIAIESPEISKKLYQQAIAFAGNRFAGWNTQKLGALVVHWARIGATKEALKLAAKIVCLHPDPRRKEKEEERKADPHAFFTRLQPQALYGIHVYKEIFDKYIKQLAELVPFETAKILAENLASAITLSFFELEEPVVYDASDIWCQNLKDADIYEWDPKTYLTHALTHACEAFLNKEPQRLPELDDILRQHHWYIFRRLRWYLYAQFPQYAKGLIRTEAVNYDGYSDGEYGFEFARMLRAAAEANVLTKDELGKIFQKIASGPDMEALKKWYGNRITDEDIQARREYFFIKQLFPFKPVLQNFPEYWKKYQAYLKKDQEPEFINYFKFRRGGREGAPVARFVPNVSPISVEELKAKSDEEILEFLSNWRPRTTRFELDAPNMYGLGEAFVKILKEQPDRFLNLADRMTVTNPTCLRDYLYFLVERVKQKQQVPWKNVIILCEWITKQPSRQRDDDKDDWRSGEPDFTSSRRSVASLFQHGSYTYPDSIPLEFRDRVFQIIKSLCTEYDNRLDTQVFGTDFLSHAINSVRGEAIHALIGHALWIKNHLCHEHLAIEKMPEVQLLIEDRLNPDTEKALSVHAVFGLLSPSLNYLDNNWFKKIKPKIFPVENELSDRWFAAWKTFVCWNNPHPVFLDIFKAEYQLAIERLESLREEEKSNNSAVTAMSGHLISFYWWGILSLTDNDSLLQRFIEKANEEELAWIMNYTGHALENTRDLLTQAIEEKVTDYWRFRLEAIKRQQKWEKSSEELSAFMWWFRSKKLSEKWCLEQLKEMLVFTPLEHGTSLVVEELAKISSVYPLDTVLCLYLITKKASADKYIFLNEKDVKSILNNAINSGINEAVKIAEETQDNLLRLGRFEYKNLVAAIEK